MNREDLAGLVLRELSAEQPNNPLLRELTKTLEDALWPVLAQVWEDGEQAGFAFGNGAPEQYPNPYGETSSGE